MRTQLKRAGAVIAAASIIVAGTVLPSSAQTPDGYNGEMLAAVNAERANVGLGPLELWSGLNNVAYGHSQNMWGDSAGQEMTQELLASYHASNAQLANEASIANCTPNNLGENLYFSTQVDAQAAVDAYMNSPGHRAAILHPDYQFLGLGTYVGEDGRLFNTQRFAAECGVTAETESEFTNLDITRNENGTLSFSLTLETGSNTVPQIEVFAPSGELLGTPAGYRWDDGVWVFEFNHNAPNVSGQYSFDYAGELGENTPVYATYNYDASTNVSGLPASLEVPLGNEEVELATISVSPGYGRTVALQELVDGEWATVSEYTVDGVSGNVTLMIDPSDEEVTRTYRVVAPQSNVAEGFTSGEVTVEFAVPDTVVSDLATEINAEYQNSAGQVTFSVDSEGPRDAYLLLGDEVVDSVEGFEGSASLQLPRYEVGTHVYTLQIPANIYGTAYSTDITVNVAKRTTTISEFEGTSEVYVGEAVEEADLLFFVNRDPGTAGVIEVLEDGEWVEAATFTVGQDHFTRATIPAVDEPGTYTYRATVAETATRTAAVSAERTVEVSLYEREASADAESHSYFLGENPTEITVTSAGDGSAFLQQNVDGEWTNVVSEEIVDGSATLTLPAVMAVGQYEYRVFIPQTTYEGWTSNSFTVDAAKRPTTISEFEGASEVYVGEAIEEADLLFFVNRDPGTAGVIEVLEDGEWVEAATFSVGQDHFTRASIPAVDEPGTYTYRATIAESATRTAAVSGERTVEVSLYEREASADAESHTYYLGDEAAEITVTAEGDGQAVLQRSIDDGWVNVISADLADGSATLTVPSVPLVGEVTYRVVVPQTATHEGWTGESFTVNSVKRDTAISGWEAGDINVSETEVTERELTVTPSSEGRTAVLERSADEGEAWEEVTTYSMPADGNFTVAIPPAELDTTFAYRVSVPETALYGGTVSDVLNVTTQEFPTNVIGVPAIDVEMEYGSGPQSFDITIDNAYGRQVLLQRERTASDVSAFAVFNAAADPNWVTVATYTAPDAEVGDVTITIPEATEVGEINYRVVVPETTRGAEWVSDVFSVIVEPAETVIPGFSSSIYPIEAEGSTEFVTFAFLEGGEDRDRVAHLEELVDGEWIRVGGPFEQGANLEQGTFDEIVVLFPVDELGASTYRVVVDPSDNYQGVTGEEFTIEIVRVEDVITGDAPEDVVVEIQTDEEIVLEYSSDNARDWLVQMMNDEGEWVTVETVANSTFVRYVIPTELVGNFTYRVVAEETDTLAEWVSETTTVEVTLQAPEVTGWDAQDILIGEGETPESITVTSDVPFTLQSRGLLGEWQELETYEAGTHEINLPAVAGVSYRLVVEETELTAGWTSGIITVLNEVVIPVPEDEDDGNGTPDDTNSNDDNNGGTTTDRDSNRTPVDNRRSTGTGNGIGNGVTTTAATPRVERLEQTGSSALALSGIAALALLTGAGALFVRNRKGSTV